MTDRELLEMAAKAAGVDYDADQSKPHPKSGAFWGLWLVINHEPHEGQRRYWNPLRDDGDALRLAVNLKIHVQPFTRYCWASTFRVNATEETGADPYAATRRAIVRAAAQIGKEMK